MLAVSLAHAFTACGDKTGSARDAAGKDAPPKRGIEFGTQGPWPVQNVSYGRSDGILESPVIAVTSDEAENRWVATPRALYVRDPEPRRSSGLVLYDPAAQTSEAIRAGQGIPSDEVIRLEVDRMTSPPSLHVATAGGAAALRVPP